MYLRAATANIALISHTREEAITFQKCGYDDTPYRERLDAFAAERASVGGSDVFAEGAVCDHVHGGVTLS